MPPVTAILRLREFLPVLAVLVLASRASGETMPQHAGAPTAFAAAGAPKEEDDAQPERPAPTPHLNDSSVDEHRLVLPDDVPMKVGEKWRGPFRRRAGFEVVRRRSIAGL
jgi:hypothetical protein